MAKDLYLTLGVARGASAADIKKAYRKLAKANHPDTHAGDAAALARFKDVSAAYTILSDAGERAKYDRGEIDADGQPKAPPGYGGFAGGGGGFGGGDGFGPQPGGGTRFDFGGDPGDIFSELFGRSGGPFGSDPRMRAAPVKGADVSYRLNVPFEDAALLKPQRIALKNGKTLDLKLTPGLESGKQVRMAGQGDPGPGGAGDALVTIDIMPHRFFTRDGADIRLDLPVRLGEAVLGAKVRVPTPEGPVMLGVPAGTTSGRTLRLRGRGFSKADGSRGDLLATLMVDLPADDAELRSFAERWEGDATRNPRSALGID
ncbi:DnaJ domain-containing protein [Polymorphobacter sp. PAMC 29334]|uniref:DnaJ C-terminal domain-containing protein n=1 Tax=Polymorphobacter sp. PAMC 29334 TaxID=2862331 RepID=UPI001C74EDA4|nr:DnaJ C-terminal domain-containing protein [Polymorphobacter sp. PAMC 29334]QYE34469.1 DnaJ domain-containing protein [Polymorphobacter sp. PAMC 29334]